MKVFLTNVPDAHVGKTTSDWDLEASDIGIFPPIGLMYLAAALQRQGRHEVKLVDVMMDGLDAPAVARLVAEYQPDVVGMTVYTPMLYDTLLLSRLVRQACPQAKVVWGGPNNLLFPRETMVHPEVDYLVLGEAEEIFPRMLDALEDGSSLRPIPGLVLREQGEVIITGEPGYIEDLNSLPFPAFQLLNYRNYFSAVGSGKAVGTICSSRGCPYHCTFCAKIFSSYRARSVENILDEMEQYIALGVQEFFFFDDLFNVTAKRIKEISERIIERGWKITWSFRGRVDGIDAQAMKLAKQAGCRQVFFGVEAGSDAGLKAIRKNITMDQACRAVRLAAQAGIVTSTNWIIGFPHHQTRQDVLDLIKTAVRTGSDYAQFNICIAYHGTEIFDEWVKKGLIHADLWRDFVNAPQPNFQEPIWEEHLSRQTLSYLLKKCYQRFYFRPMPMLRKLLRARSFKELRLLIKGGTTLLGLGGYRRKLHPEGETALPRGKADC
jgi:anaerobic magnesium-protoporphyrin IX monomethyl ester cyclase